MKGRGLRVIALAMGALPAVASVAQGQERTVPQSVERVPVVVQAPTAPLKIVPLPLWADPPARRFGIVTLLPPDTRGQFVRASVPVGELATRIGRAAVAAHQRRAERAAHEAVRQALRDYHAQR